MIEAANANYAVGLDRVRAMPGYPGAAIDRAVPAHSRNRLWPRPEVDDRFVHRQFGFDVADGIEIPPELIEEAEDWSGGRRATFAAPRSVEDVDLESFTTMRLAPAEERVIKFVIPPEQFPPRGRRKKFQIDFQIGDERPIQNYCTSTTEPVSLVGAGDGVDRGVRGRRQAPAR